MEGRPFPRTYRGAVQRSGQVPAMPPISRVGTVETFHRPFNSGSTRSAIGPATICVPDKRRPGIRIYPIGGGGMKVSLWAEYLEFAAAVLWSVLLLACRSILPPSFSVDEHFGKPIVHLEGDRIRDFRVGRPQREWNVTCGIGLR